jgi:cytochrome P450
MKQAVPESSPQVPADSGLPVAKGSDTNGRRDPPSPPGNFLIGHANQMLRRSTDFLLESHHKYGDAIRLKLGPRTAFALFHPDHVYHVLVKRRENFTKQARGYQKLRKILGNGLLTSEGDFWLRQRRLAQPAFTPQKLAGFAGAMVQAAEEMTASWSEPARTNQPVNVAGDMMRLTLRIVGETLLGTDVTDEASGVGEALTLVIEETSRRIHTPWDFQERMPTAKNRRYDQALERLNQAVHRIINDRRQRPDQGGDLLSMLMAAKDETGARMTDQQLRDEVMTFFLAGHETTAVTLTWTWYLLSKNVEARRRLEEEVDRVLAGRSPSIDDVPKLVYTKMVVQESMRLYPPVWGIARLPAEDDQIGDLFIPAGSPVLLVQYVTHRHRDFWDNPEGFDPERFLPQQVEKRHPYAYFPFAAGPRICIGNHFAMLEAVLIVASVVSRWRLNLVPGAPVIPQPRVTLRPKDGLVVTFQRRTPPTPEPSLATGSESR